MPNAADLKRSAGFNISDGTNTVGCVLSWNLNTEAQEVEISCLGDTAGDPPVIEEQYIVTSVNNTFEFTGQSLFDDAGQSAIRTASRTGAELTLEARYYNGSGYDLTGPILSYSESGSKEQFSEEFTANMRVNSITDVAAT